MNTVSTLVLTKDMIIQLKHKLLTMKAEILNRVRQSKLEFEDSEKFGGDEVDQTIATLNEYAFVANQERLRSQLLEIEFALGRIETGTFGVCEETDEPIEIERLLAIPWTRLSIEGAEIREAYTKKYARS